MLDVVPISRCLGARKGMRRGVPAAAWYARGCALEATDPAAALAAYARALAGRPDLADAWNNAGRLHHDAGELVVAESCYRLAICAAPGVALYWFNLGVVMEDAGRWSEAVLAYARAVDLDDACADAHFNLARLCEQLARSGVGDVDRHSALPDGSAALPGEACELARRALRHYVRYRQLVGRRRHQPIFK
jgi:tetratricopeptide (TPR) repeat protein